MLAAAAVVGLLLAIAVFWLAPRMVERHLNRTLAATAVAVDAPARQLHARLFVADLHADSLLWDRDLLVESAYGHVDIPRLQRGGVALQVFDAVTKVPAGQNYENNRATSPDLVTGLALTQGWPPATWRSVLQRALYQAGKLHDLAQRSNGAFTVVHNRAELDAFVARRAQNQALTAGVLGIEGLQVLEGEARNIERLRQAGFRVIGLEHFFDNDVGGSAHGSSKGGITPFGREVVRQLEAQQMLIDLAHSSPRLIDDVLAVATRPLIVSHGGVKGTCDHIRNLSDAHLQRVAASGGVVGIGYWDAAICDVSVDGIVRAIRYAASIAGIDHVALGSDFDGATTTPFDTSGVAQITAALLRSAMPPDDIAKVMGGNVLRVLRQTLPAQ
jgi:microsomal dipeptidase-like Zn-dependent dipeptidase